MVILYNKYEDINNAPPLPRGQMPIEEVFRMTAARMNYLENALKDAKIAPTTATSSNTSVETTQETGQDVVFATKTPAVTVDQLRNESVVPSLASVQDNEAVTSHTPAHFEAPPTRQNITLETTSTDNSELMDTIHAQEERINELWQTVSQMKSQLTENHSTFNETIDNISTDLSEMNSKYTQMNNFLMEIQTTQITVNNQILRHYNENYSEMMESAIEKSASEKFASKDDDENNAEDGEETGETTAESTANASTNQETVSSTDTENTKTMSFNIE